MCVCVRHDGPQCQQLTSQPYRNTGWYWLDTTSAANLNFVGTETSPNQMGFSIWASSQPEYTPLVPFLPLVPGASECVCVCVCVQ